jgi:hypothetical protein
VMTRMPRSMLVVLGVVALAVPGAAVAKQGEDNGKGKANGHAKTKTVGYVFKGLYAGDGAVDVKKGNAHVRKAGLVGETVSFDFEDARIVVADTDGDSDRDLDDVEVGDKVLVKSRLPKGDPGEQPFEARRLIDQTHAPSDDD